MRVLFCHDGPLEKDKNGDYYSIGFNDELFERYKILECDISIAMRVHEVDIVDTSKFLKLSKNNYNVIECPNISSLKGMIFKKKICYEILKKNILNSDYVIIRLPSFIGNLAISISKKYAKPYLIELVGCPWDSLWNHSLVGKIIAPYMFLKTKINVKNSNYVLYVTEKFLQKRYPTKGKSIGCSDVMLNNQCEYKNKTINLKEKKIVFGTIGNFNLKYKGQEYVIKAIYVLKQLGYEIDYQLVGSGDRRRLEKIARKYKVVNNVTFIGALTHEKIFQWLDNIDIYIQPSTTEGMPRALIEAMSRGCFCIGSDVGGIPELLDKNVIFKKKNHKEIASIISTLTPKDIFKQSFDNYNRALKYDINVLNEKRNKFYLDFKNGELKNEKEFINKN